MRNEKVSVSEKLSIPDSKSKSEKKESGSDGVWCEADLEIERLGVSRIWGTTKAQRGRVEVEVEISTGQGGQLGPFARFVTAVVGHDVISSL